MATTKPGNAKNAGKGKKATANTESTTEVETAHSFQIGDVVRFTGYAELADGEAAVLSPGERLKVTGIAEDHGLLCVVIGDDGEPLIGRQGETLFADEVEPVENEVAKPRVRRRVSEAAEREPVANIEPTPETFADDPIVEEFVHRNDNRLPEAIREMGEHRDDSGFTLGGVLAALKRREPYGKGARHATWRAFVEAEIGIGYDRAQAHIRLYETATRARIGRDSLRRVGWAKVRHWEVAVRTLDLGAEDAAVALEIARRTPTDQVKDAIDERFKDEGGDISRGRERSGGEFVVTCIVPKTKIYNDAGHTVEHALTQAKQRVPQDNQTMATVLDCICSEWLNLSPDVDHILAQDVATVVHRHGLSAVFDQVITLVRELPSEDQRAMYAARMVHDGDDTEGDAPSDATVLPAGDDQPSARQ